MHGLPRVYRSLREVWLVRLWAGRIYWGSRWARQDPTIVAAAWKKILSWPIRTLMTYHDPPPSAVTSNAHAALENAAREAKQI